MQKERFLRHWLNCYIDIVSKHSKNLTIISSWQDNWKYFEIKSAIMKYTLDNTIIFTKLIEDFKGAH